MRSFSLLLALLLGAASACGGSTDADSTRTEPNADAGTEPDACVGSGCACREEQRCQALGCGNPGSRYDADGEPRATCTSNTDCAADERCLPIVLYSTCAASSVVGCTLTDTGSCSCLITSDCGRWSHCVTASDFDADAACFVAGQSCDYLSSYASVIDSEIGRASPDTVELLRNCEIKIADARAAQGCML